MGTTCLLFIQLSVPYELRKWISLSFGEEFKSLRVSAIQEKDAKGSYKS